MFDGTKIAHLADANIYEDLCFEKKNELRRKKTVTDVTGLPQTSEVESFVAIVIGLEPLNIVVKLSIVDGEFAA